MPWAISTWPRMGRSLSRCRPDCRASLTISGQRPICSEGEIDGRVWCGDVGLPGPDRGKGGKYLLLPPDYKGTAPIGYYTMRSRTYGVFVFWRGFFTDPKELAPPVENIERTRIYPLGKEGSAKPMQFPDASNVPANMLFPTDGTAFKGIPAKLFWSLTVYDALTGSVSTTGSRSRLSTAWISR
jgi:hypothetical protein